MYKGYYLTKTNEKHILCDFKEKHSYVSLQYEKDFKKSNESLYFNFQYKLNDGNTLDISNEHFRCNEILFRPYKYFLEFDGIDYALHNSIMHCCMCTRKELYQNICVCGGTSTTYGFPERLEKEISNWVPQLTKYKVIAPPDRKYAAWIGGSIFSMLDSFQKNLISREEYLDCGPRIVHYKCGTTTYENPDLI